jgi:hypothetical protein
VLSADEDSDGDGLTNGEEIAQGSDPFVSDRPIVTLVSPADGATGVAPDTVVVVEFSQPIDPTLLGEASFVLQELGGPPLAYTPEVAEGLQRITLTPLAPLALARVHVLTIVAADIRGEAGAFLEGDLASTFTTGDFAISAPGVGSSVPENSELVIEAVASEALGLSEVRFTVNGEPLPSVPGETSFQAAYSVPSAAEAASLTIVASGRDAGGAEVASDQVTVDVGVRLALEPKLTGLPVGGAAALRLVVSAGRPSDTLVTLSSSAPAVLTVPASVVLPAGATELDVPVQAAATCPIDPATSAPAPTCVALVVATTPTGSAGASVHVSEPGVGVCQVGVARADAGCQVLAPPAGAALRRTGLAARLGLAPGASAVLDVAVLAQPAVATTPVTITSTAPEVAKGVDTVVEAGETTAPIEIQAGAKPGTTFLRLLTGNERVVIEVAVGEAPSGASPVAAPTGVAIRSSRLAGRLALAPNGTATLVVPLLGAPAGVTTPVTVTSSDPAVASAPDTVVPAGETEALLEIQTGAGPGQALLRLDAGGAPVSVEVAVGQAPSGATALAVPSGVAVRATALAARLALPASASATLAVPLLDTPAAAAVPVTVSSTNPAIADAADTVIPAGEVAADLALVTGTQAGTARLKLDFAGRIVSVEVSVGGPPSGAAAIARPAAVAAVQAGNAGTLYLPVGTSRTVSAPLRTPQKAALLGAVAVEAESRDAGIADVTPAGFVLAAGETGADVTVNAVADGETVIFFRVGPDDLRTLRVVVGVPPPGREPFTWAPPAGACVEPSGDCVVP